MHLSSRVRTGSSRWGMADENSENASRSERQ